MTCRHGEFGPCQWCCIRQCNQPQSGRRTYVQNHRYRLTGVLGSSLPVLFFNHLESAISRIFSHPGPTRAVGGMARVRPASTCPLGVGHSARQQDAYTFAVATVFDQQWDLKHFEGRLRGRLCEMMVREASGFSQIGATTSAECYGITDVVAMAGVSQPVS